MKFLVFDIGCIECGEPSQPVGIYDTQEKAERAVDEYQDGGSKWGRTGWGGQHDVMIYELTFDPAGFREVQPTGSPS